MVRKKTDDAPKVNPSDLASDPTQIGKDGPSAASKALTEATPRKPEERTLSNGTVIMVKPVPNFIVNAAMRNLDRPEPPIHSVEIGGKQIEEENHADPLYQRGLREYKMTAMTTLIDLFIEGGIEVVTLGKGVPAFDSDEWTKLPERYGVKIADDMNDRKLQWLRMCVIVTTEDVDISVNEVSRMSGLGEEEVRNAISAFRSGEIRGADHGLRAEGRTKRDHVPKTAAEPSPAD